MMDWLQDLFDRDLRELRRAERRERKLERDAQRLERKAARVTGEQKGTMLASLSTRLRSVGSARKPKATPILTGPTPVRTSFDFLSGAFVRSRTERIVNYSLVGVLAGALVIVGSQAALHKIGQITTANRVESLTTEIDTLKKQLASNADAVRYDESDLMGFFTERGELVRTVLLTEADLKTILTDLRTATPQGITLTGMTIIPPAKDVKDDKDKDKKKDATTPEIIGEITVTGEAADYSLVALWVQAMNSLEYLVDVKTTWTGSPGADSNIVLTTTARLSNAVSSARSVEAALISGLDEQGNFNPYLFPAFLGGSSALKGPDEDTEVADEVQP